MDLLRVRWIGSTGQVQTLGRESEMTSHADRPFHPATAIPNLRQDAAAHAGGEVFDIVILNVGGASLVVGHAHVAPPIFLLGIAPVQLQVRSIRVSNSRRVCGGQDIACAEGVLARWASLRAAVAGPMPDR